MRRRASNLTCAKLRGADQLNACLYGCVASGANAYQLGVYKLHAALPKPLVTGSAELVREQLASPVRETYSRVRSSP